ncbi:asparaginase [Halogeometricum borinquense DSM 11551]|uniref:Plant-type L-asparaginase n=1 Tax=Halogeometricum borinquense (strain ATCC 700274 / DSM 11551 / JCM 10706 / KCTC 4070 / PR3) TaxID=469382 RepID=E4NPV3_HALBP|nr:isoaspartyl peptidase/L-asparaginase [Halogeometricum borinquense]ADQ66586.1 asparaginase [Halogeometricum borinquense DSM 11551]ELY30694.1 asparaginase [Halogeometricum borinquense DSM 11551]
MRVIVHGGAGGVPDEPDPRQQTVDEAAETGAARETPIDAVEAAIRVMESDPAFNAGVGGAVQSDGRVRTDAGVMTSDRETGAVAGMDGVEHAVSVARVVMEETPHIFVAGDPAVDVAADFGIETDVNLFTPETRERWNDATPPEGTSQDHLAWLDDKFGQSSATASNDADLSDHDTVGAVAFDGRDFAAATSTGGRWFALAGRVGDVPQVGSGFYAAPAGAASATGAGEDIAKTTLTRRAVRHLERGEDAQSAAELAIEEFAELTGSGAGVIVADDEGVGSAYNTEGMQTGVAER